MRHLRAFTEVARLGSFGAAARALGYTQSGVSQQIQGLERIVGTAVLHRPPGGRRPVELTDAGRLLLDHAEHVLARIGATRADLAALESGERGQVAVAAIQSVGTRLLPAILRRFRADHAGVAVDITEARNTMALLEVLEDGSVDVGLTALPVRAGTFDIHPLGDDPFVLVAAAGRPERRLADLDGVRVLGSRGCILQDLVEQHLAAAGVTAGACDLFEDNALVQESGGLRRGRRGGAAAGRRRRRSSRRGPPGSGAAAAAVGGRRPPPPSPRPRRAPLPRRGGLLRPAAGRLTTRPAQSGRWATRAGRTASTIRSANDGSNGSPDSSSR